MIRLVAIYLTSVSAQRSTAQHSTAQHGAVARVCVLPPTPFTVPQHTLSPTNMTVLLRNTRAKMHPRTLAIALSHVHKHVNRIGRTRTQATNVRCTLDNRDTDQLDVHHAFNVPREIHTHVRNLAYPCRRDIHCARLYVRRV